MADLVGVFAASHTPVMLNFPDAVEEADRSAVYDEFRKLGAALAATKPQTVIVISDDHLHNFFLDNLPAFCIGAADSYASPAEHWLAVDRHALRGDSALSAHVLGEALEAGFDPAFSMQLTLDHGVLTPLVLAGLSRQVAIVPILVNCVQPPLPTMARCLQWGRFLSTAIRSYRGCERVAILATGGISHDVATPRMGMINEAFDREFLRLLELDDSEQLLRFATDHVNEAGNGAEEIRNWLMAHGAAAGHRFELQFYRPLHKWYTGIGMARWHTGDAS
ncbi:aromatic ring-opening dioxygenase catalytic subunit (LigB family) [Povalibacter uvarum]|uniref:Aromatic ring-opening dioxygenase catalytic subunit (LigB family) n=1 Tax=Povalibacter uvarum TaxID=732238 RepID=A0A841HW82_9GAMM|nr:2,3-dihydroxyphenylpropionate 1,2-dioxygenase [Povalibacter uvarum]MBB6096509.1 aromatic ring-opening dioxygenase catalytic subunit (LigB family) [Povalibacter uvarum]